MASELTIPTAYDDLGLSNVMGKIKSNSDISYDVLGLTNLLDRVESSNKKINSFNIDDLLEDKSITDSKIVANYRDLEGYEYLYLDRATKILHLGVETSGYGLALSAGSNTPTIYINSNGMVGLNVADPLYRWHQLGASYITNQETTSLVGGSPHTIITGGPNTKGQVIRGTQYGATYSSRWVAVGYEAGGVRDNIAWSDDGVTWNAVVDADDIFGNYGRAVCWGDNKFVAVGDGFNSIAYSSDGVTWTGLGTTILPTGYDVIWTGTMFVAAGGDGVTHNVLAISYDGINWSTVAAVDTPWQHSVRAICWNGSMFVAGGMNANLSGTTGYCYSYDAVHWHGWYDGLGVAVPMDVVWNGSFWLIADSQGIHYSTDGINWVYEGVIHTNGTVHIHWTGTFFIAVGWDITEANEVQMSTDGLVWTSMNITTFSGANSHPRCVGYNGTMYLIAGSGGNIYSLTGGSWANFTNPMSLTYDICSQKDPGSTPEMLGIPVAPVDQIANLAEWCDYLGTALSYVGPTGIIGAPRFISTVATGTMPYTCTSTTVNTNLNADMVDGANLSTDVLLSGNSDVLVPSQKAVKTYVDASIVTVVSYNDEVVLFNDEIVLL